MKVVVINGNSRRGSTWHCKEELIKAIEKYEQIDVKNILLPKDMPHQCRGCFSCMINGEDKCPHAALMSPIINAMKEANIIVLTSPVYALDVSGQLKSLLDHLCFMWLSHRPNPQMFKKVGATIATTAGFGLKHTTRTMTNSLKYWGVSRICSLKMPVAAMKWEEVSGKKKEWVRKKSERMAKGMVKTARKINSIKPNLFVRFMFTMMKGMMKKNDWNLRDRSHWDDQGWLTGSKPY